MNPTPVQVVRSESDGSIIVSAILQPFIGAYFIMLLLPIATGGLFAPGYIACVAIKLVANSLFTESNFLWWTRKA